MGRRPDFRQLASPGALAVCSICGAVVDPSETGRGSHTQFHEALSDLEIANGMLLDTVKRLSVVDLRREEARQEAPFLREAGGRA